MAIVKEPLKKILAPEERRLTFGEHLEELRSVIIRCLLYTALFAVGCLVFQDDLMTFFRQPYDRMMVNAEKRRARLEEAYITAAAHRERWEASRTEREARLGELRGAAGVPAGVVDALSGAHEDIEALNAVTAQLLEDALKIRSIKPTTVFIAHIKVCLIAGIFLASPVILYQIWMFVGAGLLPEERRYVLTFLPLSIGLFVAGIAFGYLVLVPVGLTFLAGYGGTSIVNAFTLDNYLSLLITLTLVLGVVFETPLAMIFSTRIGVFTPRDFARFRRYSLLIAVVAAALLTPPDPATQILLALPMVALYEIGIWLSRAFAPSKPAEAAESAGDVAGDDDKEGP